LAKSFFFSVLLSVRPFRCHGGIKIAPSERVNND
jgi:hypothetical protein